MVIISYSVARCNHIDLLIYPLLRLWLFLFMWNYKVAFAEYFLQLVVFIASANPLNLRSIVRIYFVIFFGQLELTGCLGALMVNYCEQGLCLEHGDLGTQYSRRTVDVGRV